MSLQRIEELVDRIGAIPDPESREAARQLVESVLELHGAGLRRIVEIACDGSDAARALLRRFASDELVSAVLLIYDLHPDSIETRVRRALSKWRGAAEFVAEFEGVVRVRCFATACGAKDALEAAIRDAAPDAAGIVIEENSPVPDFVPLSAIGFQTMGAE